MNNNKGGLWERIKKFGIGKIIALAVVAALVIFGIRTYRAAKAAVEALTQGGYIEEEVGLHDISKTLTGSGSAQPANSYTVTTLMSGEVLTAEFEEGDVVAKDDVLYTMDSSDVSGSLERTQISVNQANRSLKDAQDNKYIKAPASGQLVSMDVKVGDYVNQGQMIAVVRDNSLMTLKLPFPAENAKTFYVGQPAVVTMDGSFEQLSGSVSAVSEADMPGTGNTITRSVSIEINNPGALTVGQFASASVGGVDSSGAAQLTAKTDRYITAMLAGEVVSISAGEGSHVENGQLILTLGGSSIDKQIQMASESLRNAQLSMQSTRDQLDNYTIKSPISGTIVDKQVKAGDTISGGKLLCTIYDLSYLEVTLQVDELDISDIKVGQKVSVKAEAVPGKSFDGEVTKVSVAGSTIGGTTAYPVTIRINDFEGLLPGMNVDAEIQIASLSSVLAIPNEAVSRGDVVLVTADSPAAKNAVEGLISPEGYVFVPVTLGISDDDFVEITAGLSTQDKIYYIPDNGGNGNIFLQMMNMRQNQLNGGQ